MRYVAELVRVSFQSRVFDDTAWMFSQYRGSYWRSTVSGLDPCAALRVDNHTHTLMVIGTVSSACVFSWQDSFVTSHLICCDAIRNAFAGHLCVRQLIVRVNQFCVLALGKPQHDT